MNEEKPTGRSILEGTLAQILGGALGSFTATTLASFHVFMVAGWESAFGSLCGIVAYISFKSLRRR